MRVDTLPRFPLATLPTPLEDMPRLSEELDLRILIKRDDLTGFAFGGNKVRKLELLLADAVEKNADVLVTGGGVQSNHARTTAAAARKAGMDSALVFFGNEPPQVNGNLLLDEILGAQIIYAGTDDKNETDAAVVRVTEKLKGDGRNPYLIPVGGSTARGCAAYILAVAELLDQLRAEEIEPDALVITTGSGGTHAGILAGLEYFGSSLPVHGITVSRSVEEGHARIKRLVGETSDLLDYPLTLADQDITIHGEYIGPGYARITPEARLAIQRVARLEGIFLDPVYTGKAMAGLIDLTRRRLFKPGATVIFWHTGGAPGIFGFAQDLI
jgi:D-cysteine desulfhydrase family pyridoxal phosphate-dependent enzyme